MFGLYNATMNDTELNPFLKHEALDRCSLLASMADDYLLNHEYVQARPDLLALVTEAVDKLAATRK